MTNSDASVVVIVLNFRTPEITIDCLRTLAAEAAGLPGLRVVLIDNASGDDSVPKIRAAIDENAWVGWLDFRPLPTNLGFSGGNNVVVREILAEAEPPRFLLFLNSDTLVHAGCLARCMHILATDPTIGALSCMLLNRDGSVQNVCRRFPRPDREVVRALGLPWLFPKFFSWADLEDPGWDRKAGPRDVDWVGGAFLMMPIAVVRKSGSLSEQFFFYGEDCELCFRVHRAGYRVRFDPSASIVHLGGASSDGVRLRNRTKEIYRWQARLLIQRKCYGPVAEWTVRGAYILAFGLRMILLTLRGRRKTDAFVDAQEGFSQLTGPLRP